MEDPQSSTAAPLFDASRRFGITIDSGGKKRCVLQGLDKDALYCDLSRKIVTVRRFLGRGKTKSETPGAEALQMALFQKLRVDQDGPEFNAFDAAAAMERFERADVIDVTREGDRFRVTLEVVGGAETVHVLRVPTMQQMHDHGRDSVSRVTSRKSQEVRGFLEPSGLLYDQTVAEVTGYAGPVPIVHKTAVVQEVLQQLFEAREDEAEIPE